VPSGPPQRLATGARPPAVQEHKVKKEKQNNFAENINKTFVSSLVKPDHNYLTAVCEPLDEFARVDLSAVRAEIVQQIATRTKTEHGTTQAIVTLLERGYCVPFIHSYRRDVTVSWTVVIEFLFIVDSWDLFLPSSFDKLTADPFSLFF